MEKMRVISGEHKGEIVEVTGIFWGCKTIAAKLDDGTESYFGFNEVENIER